MKWSRTIGGHKALPASAFACFRRSYPEMSCEIWYVFILSIGCWKILMFMLLCFPFFLSVSLYLFNRSISSALPVLFIYASFSAGRVSFLGVTMATTGSLYPFQSPHRFTTTSAWSKTSSSQVKRALHSKWKHILNVLHLKFWNWNFNPLGHASQEVE